MHCRFPGRLPAPPTPAGIIPRADSHRENVGSQPHGKDYGGYLPPPVQSDQAVCEESEEMKPSPLPRRCVTAHVDLLLPFAFLRFRADADRSGSEHLIPISLPIQTPSLAGNIQKRLTVSSRCPRSSISVDGTDGGRGYRETAHGRRMDVIE